MTAQVLVHCYERNKQSGGFGVDTMINTEEEHFLTKVTTTTIDDINLVLTPASLMFLSDLQLEEDIEAAIQQFDAKEAFVRLSTRRWKY